MIVTDQADLVVEVVVVVRKKTYHSYGNHPCA
jgi:hypothetical protein